MTTPTPVLPREWCATGTKTDPGAAAALTGFVAGNPVSSAAVNFLLNQLSKNQRRIFTNMLCQPRATGIYTDDNSGIATAVSLGQAGGAIVITMDTGGPVQLFDGVAHFSPVSAGPLVSITSDITGSARNPVSGRIVVVGTGGNRNCYSDDTGATWTAGGDLGGNGLGVIFNPTYTRFQAIRNGHALYSTNAVAWTDVAVASIGLRGIALLPNGDVVAGTGAGSMTLSRSQDGGTSWAATGTISAPTAVGFQVAGAGLDNAYLAVIRGGNFECWRSSDGNTWALAGSVPTGTLAMPGTAVASMRQCPDTGILFAYLQGVSSVPYLVASSDQGVTWTDAVNITNSVFSGTSFGVAGGRAIFNCRTNDSNAGQIMTTDGLGWA